MTTRYKVLIWCRDCFGIDPQGCFNGDSEWLGAGAPAYEDAVFDTAEAAEAAADDAQNRFPLLGYEVVPVEHDG